MRQEKYHIGEDQHGHGLLVHPVRVDETPPDVRIDLPSTLLFETFDSPVVVRGRVVDSASVVLWLDDVSVAADEDGTFQFDVGLEEGEEKKIVIEARDAAGNTSRSATRHLRRRVPPWRKSIAHIPFFSELDMQAMGNANGTLTYTLCEGAWHQFPVPYTVYTTKAALSSQNSPQTETVDHGLILRETPPREVAPERYWNEVAPGTSWERMTAGMYWERTIRVSNRHPADCLHAWVDLGPLEVGQSRTVCGKIYLIEGTKDDLLDHWRVDFN